MRIGGPNPPGGPAPTGIDGVTPWRNPPYLERFVVVNDSPVHAAPDRLPQATRQLAPTSVAGAQFDQSPAGTNRESMRATT